MVSPISQLLIIVSAELFNLPIDYFVVIHQFIELNPRVRR